MKYHVVVPVNPCSNNNNNSINVNTKSLNMLKY